MNLDAQPKRWVISIRASILVLGVLAVVFALIGNQVREAQAQERAFTEIAKRGGTILVYDEGVYVHFTRPAGLCGTGLVRVISPSNAPQAFGDGDLAYLLNVSNLRSVNFTSTRVSQNGIRTLRQKRPECHVSG